MSTIKTYANKSGLIKALRRAGVADADHMPQQNDEGRWFQGTPKVVIPNVVNSVAALAGVALPCEAPKTVKLFGRGIKIEKNREERNGIKRPSIGGACRAVWDECDRIHAETGLVPMPKQLKAWAREVGANENNAVIELYVWRKFMGFTKSKA
ncbi:UNVERIFIED_ORG: hypothetical protein GCAPEGMB_00399 [Vibrio phage V07]